MSSRNIIRTVKRDNPYAVIDKRFLGNVHLSFKAKGILAYLLSKPDNWQILVSDLIKQSTDGRDSVYSGLKELEMNGYLERKIVRDGKGKFLGYEYVVYEAPKVQGGDHPYPEIPYTENPYTENPDTGKPYTENPQLLNNDLILSNDLTNNDLTNNLINRSYHHLLQLIDHSNSGVKNGIDDEEDDEEEVRNFIQYASKKGIEVHEEFARSFLRAAGGLEKARDAVDRSVEYASRPGVQIKNPAGLLVKTLEIITSEAQVRFTEKNGDSSEKSEQDLKYADLYLT